ncbi:phage tail sheath subtilisin-like domain-containing protein [Methyloversatilis sp. XJ19-13]|uniref:phage tail sheath C-terminal domain-containing protein n=1 Tax=Methyloversatilis sp. XJ19-13 TaxID=2963430 RepID=UPI00211B90A2|nr:phage tail sheath C-terminal domain-containing protein [Methyloversatilis sp. XJ19-13]MCQ9375153.1 phage tail sheath subtilisin-like domain-containing protein [Methyloversatilis sp. XJ19-13]
MPSPNVSFSQVPGSIRTPGTYIEFNARLALRNLPNNRQTVRLIGGRTSSGTGLAGVPTQVFTDAEAATYFGAGSHLHLMVRALLKANPYVDLTAIAVDDNGAGVAATGTVTIAGTATSTGTLSVKIGAQSVDVLVESGDLLAAVAADLVAAITARPDLPVTAAAVSGVVTLTAKNKGTTGNDIKVSATLTGVTGVTATVVAMASGATNPDIAATLTAIQSAGDEILVMPWTDTGNLTKLRDHLELVGNALEQRGAIGIVGTHATYGAAVALAAGINDERVLLAWLPGSASLPWETAAALAAIAAFEEDPARPLNGLELIGLDVPPIASRPGRTEIENCLHNGVTPLKVSPGERVTVVRAVSTYTVNGQAVADPAWLDITTIRTLDYVRFSLRQRITARFPREKATARVLRDIRSEVIDVLLRLEDIEIVENVAANIPGVIVELDSVEVGRVNVRVPTDVVNGLHVIAAVIDLIL